MYIYQSALLKADVSISAAGDNTIITIGAGEMPTGWDNSATYIAIDHINLVPASAVTVQLKDGASTDANIATSPQTNYGGAYQLTSNQGFVLENAIQNEHGLISLKPNHSFVINLSGAVQVSGFIRYRLLMTN